MITISASAEIGRPPEEVFLFAGDYANDPVWRAGVVEMVYEGGPSAAVGVRTRETMRSLGSTVVTVAEITQYSRSRTAFRSLSGPVACEGSREFAAVPGGTRFSYSLTLRPEGFFRIIGPILERVLERQVRGDVRRLKDHLERR
jgi:uncharacterized membrane protein